MDRFASTNSSSCASLLSSDKDLVKYIYCVCTILTEHCSTPNFHVKFGRLLKFGRLELQLIVIWTSKTAPSFVDINLQFRLAKKNIWGTSDFRRTRDSTSRPYIRIPIALEAAQMSQRNSNYWDASDDSDTDAADAADLAEQPESIDEHKRVDIYFPELQRIKPRKLNQLKTDLRNKFNISEIEENGRTCVLSVSGYGFDHEDVLREVRRYDSKAS